MKQVFFLCLAAVMLGGCFQDETLAAYGAEGKTWHLHSIDGADFAPRATIIFGEKGGVSGQGPCNSWFGTQTAPYPWFALENIGASKKACPALPQESTYFAALRDMSLAEVSGDILILSNDAGRRMEFEAR